MIASRRIDFFYDGFEEKALDRPLGRLQSAGHLRLRTAYRFLRGSQPYTGFYTAFRNLKAGLESLGFDVRVNDFAHARRNPRQPIGMAGFPAVFDSVVLPNPAVFGPGEMPMPQDIARVTEHNNIRIFTQPSDWATGLYRDSLGDRVQTWFAPIMLRQWPDLSRARKTTDVLIYDKIYFDREIMAPRILDRLRAHLDRRGLRHVTLRYGDHRIRDFRKALKASRVAVFLSAHETQGLAYQEAMASGLPVLAWNEGRFCDPNADQWPRVAVSSVPYFDERCGMTFVEAKLEQRFDAFWSARDQFRPRAYVAEMLNPRRSGQIYLDLLRRAGEEA